MFPRGWSARKESTNGTEHRVAARREGGLRSPVRQQGQLAPQEGRRPGRRPSGKPIEVDMQLSINAPAASPIAFGLVKELLMKVGCGPETPHPRFAQSLRLYFPLDLALADRVRASSVSLTDGATASEQIRYFQRRRLRRNHIMVARHVAAHCGDIQVEIGRCHDIDEPSREFLDLASSVAGWNISYVAESVDAGRSRRTRGRPRCGRRSLAASMLRR